MSNNALSSALTTLANGVLAALFAGIASGFVAEQLARWGRVGNAEGARGYFVVFGILLGAVAGLVIGLVCARVVVAGPENHFLRGLGLSIATVTTGLLLITGVAYLRTDHPPRLNGRRLELELEIRLPPARPGVSDPDLKPVISLHGADPRACSWGVASSNVITDPAGHRTLSLVLDLASSHPRKTILVSWPGGPTVTYQLPLSGRPADPDFHWSTWLEPEKEGTDGPSSTPNSASSGQLRYRVRHEPEQAPPAAPEEIKAQQARSAQARFAALTPESPLPEWLEYASPYSEAKQQPAALQGIAARTNLMAELVAAARAPETGLAAEILRVVPRLPLPAPNRVELVLAAGRELLERMKQTIDTPAEADPGYDWAMQLDALFLGWHSAAEELRTEAPQEFADQLRAILQLARRRPDSQALRHDVVRIGSFYLQKWTGEAPLPTDPPPR